MLQMWITSLWQTRPHGWRCGCSERQGAYWSICANVYKLSGVSIITNNGQPYSFPKIAVLRNDNQIMGERLNLDLRAGVIKFVLWLSMSRIRVSSRKT